MDAVRLSRSFALTEVLSFIEDLRFVIFAPFVYAGGKEDGDFGGGVIVGLIAYSCRNGELGGGARKALVRTPNRESPGTLVKLRQSMIIKIVKKNIIWNSFITKIIRWLYIPKSILITVAILRYWGNLTYSPQRPKITTRIIFTGESLMLGAPLGHRV